MIRGVDAKERLDPDRGGPLAPRLNRRRPGLQCLTAAGPLAAALLLWSASSRAQVPEGDPWLGPDKALHFGASAVLAGGGYTLGALASEETAPRFIVGAGVALTAGAAKELYDLTGRGDFSLRDLTWDAIGTATGLLISYAVDRLFFAPSREQANERRRDLHESPAAVGAP